MRGSAASAPASHSCMSARVMASSAAKGSSSSSTGRPASSVRRKATRWRMPPESAAGRARSNSASPKRSNSGAARSRASRAAARPGLERQRGVAQPVAPGQQQVALGHVGAGRAAARGGGRPGLDRALVGLLEPGGELEQGGLAAARSGPTTATTSPGATLRSTPSSAATSAPRRRKRRLRRRAAPRLQTEKRLRHGSLGLCSHRSLRGHYPTGSEGRRRADEAPSQPAFPRAPLLSRRSLGCGGGCSAGRQGRPGGLGAELLERVEQLAQQSAAAGGPPRGSTRPARATPRSAVTASRSVDSRAGRSTTVLAPAGQLAELVGQGRQLAQLDHVVRRQLSRTEALGRRPRRPRAPLRRSARALRSKQACTTGSPSRSSETSMRACSMALQTDVTGEFVDVGVTSVSMPDLRLRSWRRQ